MDIRRNRLIANVDGRRVRVELRADGRVDVEGVASPFAVRQLSPGEYLVSDGDGALRWRVFVAGPADARQVQVDGAVFDVELAREGAHPRSARGGRGDAAVAPMPATVIEIAVETGQEVRQGDVLVTLEAMKMELPLRAPHDGRVAAIRCQRGDLVQPGTLLVEIE